MSLKYYKVECFSRRNGRRVDYPYTVIVRSTSKDEAIKQVIHSFAKQNCNTENLASKDSSYAAALKMIVREKATSWNLLTYDARKDCISPGRFGSGRYCYRNHRYFYKATICKHYKDED